MYPHSIRVGDASEYLSQVSADWCNDNGVKLAYNESGKPIQNAYIERFKRTCRHEVLDGFVIESLNLTGNDRSLNAVRVFAGVIPPLRSYDPNISRSSGAPR